MASTSVEGELPDWFSEALDSADGRYRSIEHEGSRIFYQVWGRSGLPPLLMLHGAGASSEWWEATAILLADNFHIVAPSLSGCGRSEWRENYCIEQNVEEVLACAAFEFDTNTSAGVTCVAHSFGSETGMRLALDPARPITQLILVDCLMGLYDSPAPSFRLRERLYYPSQEDAVSRFSTVPRDNFGPAFLRNRVALQSLEQATDEDGNECWSWKADPNVMARLSCAPAFSRLGEATCPVDFIYGGQSSMNSAELREQQAETLGGKAAFLEIEEAGHHIPLDRPRELAEAIRQLVKARASNVQSG